MGRHRRLRWTLAGVALGFAGLDASAWGPLAQKPWAVALPEMVKVAPGARPSGAASLELSAARGECAGGQLYAAPPLSAFKARATPLRLEGASPLQASLSREAFLELANASNAEGRTGRWPDPLIPVTDGYAGEPRRAFPYSSARDPGIVYVEICVPRTASPGRYRGAILLEAGGRPALEVAVDLQVLRFALPATSSLPTSFGFSAISAAKGHGVPVGGETAMELNRRYAQAALRHRISLHGMSMEPPRLVTLEPLRLDFAEYDRELAPFLDGTALPDGARFTSFDVRLHPKLRRDDQRAAYLRAYATHLREKGWLDRAFVYLKDEPRPEDLPDVRRLADVVHRASPDLRALVTTSLAPPLAGGIDLWTPNLNCLFQRAGDAYCAGRKPIDAYAPERGRGAKLWWYQSCGSHGCGPLPRLDLRARGYFSGWPSYMIDHDAALNRAMGALAFRYGIDGELYFNTVEAYHPEKPGALADPWTDVWRFHGNGDGTLFYPGTPDRIGGTTHVPIESLRLKLIRAGLQDYEYLALARSLGLREEADAVARALAPQPFEITRDPVAWQRARARLAAAIERALEGQPNYARDPPVQVPGRP